MTHPFCLDMLFKQKILKPTLFGILPTFKTQHGLPTMTGFMKILLTHWFCTYFVNFLFKKIFKKIMESKSQSLESISQKKRIQLYWTNVLKWFLHVFTFDFCSVKIYVHRYLKASNSKIISSHSNSKVEWLYKYKLTLWARVVMLPMLCHKLYTHKVMLCGQ